MTPYPITITFTAGRRQAFGLVALLIVSTSLPLRSSAQVKSQSEATASNTEEVIVLSPFFVDASSEDSGYQANNTLAGTRLRSSLKDVAAPISVFTADLLKNIGATNFQEAMLYSVNVENEREFAPDDTEGESISSTTQNRVRGLAASTQTRGYFKTNFRADTYNTDRLTVASGPNSILFGLGSPAGIVDATPIVANTRRRSTSLGFRVDNNGSVRTNVDFNLPLIKSVLAVRVAAFDQRVETYRQPEFDDERRTFVTVTASPLKNTTIRASYEDMKNHRVRGRNALMQDNISDWIALGKPLYDFTTKTWTLDNGATWITHPELSSGFINTGGIGHKDRVYMAGGQLGGSSVQGLVWTNTGLSYDRNKVPTRTFANGLFVPSDVNYHGLGSHSKLAGDISTVVLEQKIVNNLFAEFAYNREHYTRDQDDPLRLGLSSMSADVNYYLPYPVGQTSGALVKNPNRGRYMIESEYLGYTQNLQSETLRAMLSYSVDFAKHGHKWLGEYNAALMWQRETSDNFKIKRRLMNNWKGADWIGPPTADFGMNNVKSRYYIDLPALGGDANGLKYPGAFTPPPWDYVIGGIQPDGRPQNTRNQIEGKLLVLQGFLLDKSLVLTYGYRADKQKAYWTTYTQRDPVTNEFITKGVGYDRESGKVQSGITTNYGGVYHTPLKWLSLLYNRSDAFHPQGNFFDWFGKPLPAGSGKGEDVGINLSFLGGKLQARINRFTNSSKDTVELDWYYEEPKWSIAGTMDAPGWGHVTRYATRLGNTSDLNIKEVNDSIRATRDYKSTGHELELFYKPMPRLDLRFTLSESKAVSIRNVPLLREYIEARRAVWEKYYGYKAWGQWDAIIPAPDPNWINNPNSLGYLLLNGSAGFPRVEAFKAEEGSVTTRGRRWRSNLIANYNFSEKLNGLSVGGAARLRSSDTIGYRGKPSPLNPLAQVVVDIRKPIKGDDIRLFDAWIAYSRKLTIAKRSMDWNVQLNVQNLLNDNGFTPLSAHTDGTYTSYMRNEPRTVILTNTFKF